MKKSIVLTIILISAVVLLGIYLTIIRSPITGNQILSVKEISVPKIILENGEFYPSEIKINVGDEIIFENKGDVVEIVFIEKKYSLKNYQILPKNMVIVNFEEQGNYSYTIKSNFENIGKIIVE